MTASDVVKVAKAELGYKEKASNSQLDSATANAGSANYTKYARDLQAAGYYNGGKNGFAWCDVFIDWCFYQAAGKDKAKAEAAEFQTGTLGAGCGYSKQYYKNKGRCDKNPKVGDQVFFQQGGSVVHTGIVIAVSGSTITTIEGNSSNMVKQNSYSLSNSYVDSFGHPLYDEEDDTSDVDSDSADATTDAAVSYGDAVSVELNSIKKGSKGPQVKTIQRIIYARGINKSLVVDGEFGALTYNGVLALQKQLFPDDQSEWDGEVGSKTWTAVLTQLD